MRYQAVCSSAVRKASPIVTGTKKKWLIDVNANCQRARSSVIGVPPSCSPGRYWRGQRRALDTLFPGGGVEPSRHALAPAAVAAFALAM